ncbi:class I SAM-dependent methyltransferase [Nocardia thraciensis]
MNIVNTHQAEAWNGYEGQHWADNRERYDALVGGSNAELLAAAAIGTDDRVLDIGCGAGQVSRLAALRAMRGRVLGVDLSGPMLEQARRVAVAERIGNVSYEQGDAQVHPFPTAGFEVAISRGGIMYFSDPVAAFGNIRRALASGGRLAFYCGRDHGHDESARIWSAMTRHVELPNPADDTAPGPVNFTNREHITGILTDAGFTDVNAEPLEGVSVYGRDAEDAVEFIFGMGPVRYWLRDTDPAAVEAARNAVAEELRPFEGDGGVRLRGPSWLFTATRSEQ